jgi:hypothetical protein
MPKRPTSFENRDVYINGTRAAFRYPSAPCKVPRDGTPMGR